MYKRTEGIVLTNHKYGEADLIVTYLSKEYGILYLYAKSCRKIKSRFGSSLEPFTYSRIAFIGKEQTNLPKLVQSDIIISFNQLRESYTLFFTLSEIVELTLKLFPEKTQEKKLFILLFNTLQMIDKYPKNSGIFITFYKIRILQFGGFSPILDRCIRCGGKGEKFYISEGGILCHVCADYDYIGKYIKVSESMKNLYKFLLKVEPETVARLRIKETLRNRLEELITSHINYIIMKK